MFNHQRFIDHALKTAEQTLRENGELIPMMLFFPYEGPICGLPCPWKDETDKRLYLSIGRFVGVACDAEAAAVISEGWMLGQDAKDPVDILPSQSERRIEVVMAAVSWRDPETDIQGVMAMARIERNAKGKVTHIVRINMGEGTSSGRMLDLLSSTRPTTKIRELANEFLHGQGIRTTLMPLKPN